MLNVFVSTEFDGNGAYLNITFNNKLVFIVVFVAKDKLFWILSHLEKNKLTKKITPCA